MDPITMALIGAGIGAGGAAITGGDIGQGALMGGLGGLAGGFIGGSAVSGSTAFGLSKAGLLAAGGAGVFGALGSGGGSSTGFAPSAKITLTPAGKELEKGLFESIKGDLFPENLASKYIGKAKRTEGKRRRTSEQVFNRAAGKEVTTGGVGSALIEEFSSRQRGGTEGIRQGGEARTNFAKNRLTDLQNFMNLQTQTPVLRAQADLVSSEQEQLRGAQQGASLGNIAQLLAVGFN